jgi:8-oxo-dGTP diphosphatase
MSIHTPNFCPRCGTELEPDEFDGDTRGYCSVCETHVFHLPSPAAGVVVLDDDRVLLVQRDRPPFEGQWELPAGVIEHGETPREAAARELTEETTLEVSPDALTLTKSGGHALGATDEGGEEDEDTSDTDVFVVETTFAVSRSETTGEPTAGGGERAARFWPLAEIRPDLRPGEHERIRHSVQALDS